MAARKRPATLATRWRRTEVTLKSLRVIKRRVDAIELRLEEVDKLVGAHAIAIAVLGRKMSTAEPTKRRARRRR